jgi:hypothetical protein
MPNVLWWVIHLVISILIFVLVQWLLPALLGLAGVAIPANIVTVVALLIALLYFAGGWYAGLWRRPVP